MHKCTLICMCTKNLLNEMTHQRVETYSVYGGIDDNSLASPKSAILRTSFVTSKFSLEKKRNLIINLLTKSRDKNMQYEI